MDRVLLGVDVGGSGIKGAPVDTRTGELVKDRFRIETPQPSEPEQVARVVRQLAKHFDWHGPMGVTIPGVVKSGVVMTAANIDKRWIGTDARELFAKATGQPATVLNDADAAGLAEMRFGAGLGRNGVVVMITLGTGIGFALFNDGRLVPNTELGHLEMRGRDAESIASARVREENDESWKHWARDLDEYLDRVDALLWPDLIIVGGGVSKKWDRFAKYLNTRAELVPAALQNDAGIVGAAMAAAAS